MSTPEVPASAAGPRRVVVDGVVVRTYFGGISRKPHTLRWKAHRSGCRHVNDQMRPMADLVAQHGHDSVRTKIAVGRVEVCSACNPVLLEAARS